MKIPKQTRRHCPYCNKHTDQSVAEAKRRGRNKTRPMSRGSKNRVQQRGQWRGTGNLGRFSRPPVGARKMTGKKTSSRMDLRYKCKECGKIAVQKRSLRAKKVEIQ